MRLPIIFIKRKRLESIEEMCKELKDEMKQLRFYQKTINADFTALDHSLGKRVDSIHYNTDDLRRELRRAINCRLCKSQALHRHI